MKVGYVCFSLTGGGAERNAINITSFLLKKQIDTTLVTFKNINDYTKEYKKITQTIPLISLLKGSSKIPPFLLPIKTVQLVINFYKITQKERYDVLIAGSEYLVFYFTCLISLFTNTKCILVIGDNISTDLLSKNFLAQIFHRLFHSLSFKFSDRVICVSEGLAKQMQRDFDIPSQKIRVVYNGVDIHKILSYLPSKNSLSQTLFSPKHKIIFAFGRLVPKKGHIHLIRAFALLKKEHPNLKLVIIGKGPLLKKLQDVIKFFDLTQDVKLLGFIKENPYSYIKGGEIFVFSSLYEGFGNVIIEAMACGLPIISTDCLFGPREILTGAAKYSPRPIDRMERAKYGILVPPLNHNSFLPYQQFTEQEKILAQAINLLLKDKQLKKYYKDVGRKRGSYFTSDKMSRQYYSTILELLNK